MIKTELLELIKNGEQQARLFALGGMLHAKPLPVSGTGLEDLDLERRHDDLARVLDDPEVPRADAALRVGGIRGARERGAPRATLALSTGGTA